MKRAPNTIEDAKTFCCCFPYKDYHICIYAGGGSRDEHSMYWGYVIYDHDGERISYDEAPSWVCDVDDVRHYCEQMIEGWLKPLDYEEIRQWRDICEFLNTRKYKICSKDVMYRHIGKSISPLITYDRHRRQKMWDKYKIQLIIWDSEEEVWQLKGNWEDKIWFLEQVYILNRDPDSLPRSWKIKWEKKCYKSLGVYLSSIARALSNLKNLDSSDDNDHKYINSLIFTIRFETKKAKELLKSIRES